MTPRHLFRRVAVAEAVTWALLLLGMVLKYVTHTTELGVRVFGMVHGVVFIAYCLVTVVVGLDRRWSWRVLLTGLAAAVPPFATIAFERVAERRGLVDDGPWRLGPGGEAPAGALERAQAWLLARPVAALGVAVVAVLALTGVALLAGPPVPASS